MSRSRGEQVVADRDMRLPCGRQLVAMRRGLVVVDIGPGWAGRRGRTGSSR